MQLDDEHLLDDVTLGLGAWAWGDRFYWGYGRDYTERDVWDAFAAGLASRVHFFDTAEIYGFGQSERILGTFLDAVEDDAVVIATKFMPLPWRWRVESLLEALRDSLHRLGLSAVDLYQIHRPPLVGSIERWADALADAVDAGLARAVGVSNYNVDQMQRTNAVLADRGVSLASNQVEYSLLNREPEHDGLLAACRELGVELIAYSPLGQGILTGKYTPDKPPSGIRRWRHLRRLERIRPLVRALRDIGGAHGGKTPAQVALNWVICKGAIPIPGAKNAQQASENAGAVGWRLRDEEIARLDALSGGS